MFKKEQKGSKNNLLIAVLIAGMTVILCAGTVSAGDDSRTARSPEQLASLNASMEQIFLNIPQSTQKVEPSLFDKLQKRGKLPVIVRLREGAQPYGVFSDKKKPRSEVITSLQKTVLGDVITQTSGEEADLHVKRFSLIPAMALVVDAPTLEALRADPKVIDIIEDIPLKASLYESVPLIGAGPDGTFSTYTGSGQTVAILDTGVDKNHPFLGGKVVSEACYSSNIPAENVTSLCPGGVAQSTAVNSALPCDSICNHGTHVAGIVAGKRVQLTDGTPFSGVAQDADIIAIQVFSRIDGNDVTAYMSDVELGLERVYALRNTYSIASVNMSLGGGEYDAFCDASPLKTIIDMLRMEGIATIIASGNDSYPNSIAQPACISSAVSVGNTTLEDEVWDSSNSADFLSLLAPGTLILSSVPGDGDLDVLTGTSMAAPHVAGAWAVIKEANPDASVTDALSALQQTGVPIADWRSETGYRVKSRIDVQAALERMQEGCFSNADCDDGIFCNGGEMCVGGECVSGTEPCEAEDESCDETADQCFCDIPWDLNRDCYVDKDDAKILKILQKIEKIDLKINHAEQKDFIKYYMDYYVSVCGAPPDFNGNCYIDKGDAKILKTLQKIEKTNLKNNHKAEKAAMKAALQ